MTIKLIGVSDKKMQFSLCFFAASGLNAAEEKYQLLLESAKFADQHNFAGVWIPERHFHKFGGLYPNPSVTGAALAMITKQIQIRAGSVVLPLQNPLRVAEEWSIVDNLSKGRVALSFASGWHVDDFVLSPENYANRREVMFNRIEIVQKLWQGHTIKLPNGVGNEVEVRILPRPIQPELPIWITGQSEDTFIKAGEIGANVITNLNYKSIEDLSERIEHYRRALAKHGHNPEKGLVTLMIHTFIGNDISIVREKVSSAYGEYILANLELQTKYATGLSAEVQMTEEDKEFFKTTATERLFNTHGLVGNLSTCLQSIKNFKAIGVNEVACLIDFGIDFDSVMESLNQLKKLKELCNL